jgi:uncharacterized protein YacL
VQQRDHQAVPPAVLEVLRLCIVAFLGSAGYALARGLGVADTAVGPFDGQALGLLLGAFTGYVAGGLVARLTFRTVAATERALTGRSAEQLLAGLLGAVGGVLVAAALCWPMMLLGQQQYTAPLFVFVLVTVGILGYRLGLARREGMLDLLRGGGGLALRPTAVAALPRVLDTSVAIDARIVDVVRAGFLHGTMLVCQPVIDELQAMADAGDEARRAKGRRGLDSLQTLRGEPAVQLEVVPDPAPELAEVDAKLVRLGISAGAALLTLDTGLARAAAVAGCRVMNLHALALALRPPVVVGDLVPVQLSRTGKDPGQAVGYLDDGTMVVVDSARELIGREVTVNVVSVLVTANGRLVFGRVAAPVPAPR